MSKSVVFIWRKVSKSVTLRRDNLSKNVRMERIVYKQLLKWKNSNNRKPLIINGARQVGKTWLLKEFGTKEYKNIAYVSLDKNSDAADVFERDFDIDRIIRQLSAIIGIDIMPETTLLVLDEIQSCPRAMSSLKYFCEDASQYHVTVAGSLLGISLHENYSFPVGKVDMIKVYPMNFDEFLLAMGRKKMQEFLEQRDYKSINQLSDSFVELLRQYFFVGGMPGVVEAYVQGAGPVAVRQIQKQILFDYERDFSKHAPAQQIARIHQVWQSVPSQLFKENKKFRYADLKHGGRAADFELAIQWLVDAGLVCKVCRCNEPLLPLKIYEDPSAFKLFAVDCGLLGAMVDAPASQLLIGDNAFREYKGGLAEQFVFQQMQSHESSAIYYYSSDNSRMEIDFLIQDDAQIVPIEVKAGVSVQSNAFKTYIKQHPELHSIRYSLLPYIQQENFENVPLFAVR